jgi:hypothetical protein
VRVRPEALESLRLDRDNLLTRQFPLLEAAGGDGAEAGGEAISGVATVEAPGEAE